MGLDAREREAPRRRRSATIIVLVILLIAANTMAMAARERVTEIAVLRTLGFPKETILGLVLGESLALSLFGGLLGLCLFVVAIPGFRERLMLTRRWRAFAATIHVFPEVLVLGVRRDRRRRPPRRPRPGHPLRPRGRSPTASGRSRDEVRSPSSSRTSSGRRRGRS